MTIEEFGYEVNNLNDVRDFCEEYGCIDYWYNLDFIHTDNIDDEIEERIEYMLRYNSWRDVHDFLREVYDSSGTGYQRNDECFSPVTYDEEIDIINNLRDYLEGLGFFDEEEEVEEGAEETEEPLELIDTTVPDNIEQFVLEEEEEEDEDKFCNTEEEEEYLMEAITEAIKEDDVNVMEELNNFLGGC